MAHPDGAGPHVHPHPQNWDQNLNFRMYIMAHFRQNVWHPNPVNLGLTILKTLITEITTRLIFKIILALWHQDKKQE